MQLKVQEQETVSGPRFDPELVRKAAVVAERLQQEQQAGLSLAEVDALAGELGIDPACMRQALASVASAESEQRRRERQARALKRGLVAGGVMMLSGGLLLTGLVFVRTQAAALTPATPLPASAAGASLIRNGSFEAGPPVQEARRLHPGSTLVSRWLVDDAASVEYLQMPGLAATGRRSIHLPGQGAIQQAVPTEPGRRYRVTFRMAGKPGAAARVARLHVWAGRDLMAEMSTFTDAAGEPVRWREQFFEFPAMDSGTTLRFVNNDTTGRAGAVIDDVSVALVTP